MSVQFSLHTSLCTRFKTKLCRCSFGRRNRLLVPALSLPFISGHGRNIFIPTLATRLLPTLSSALARNRVSDNYEYRVVSIVRGFLYLITRPWMPRLTIYLQGWGVVSRRTIE